MPTIEELQAQKDKNSQAWHSASQAEKDRLHQENIKLQQQIDSMTGGNSSFNSSTGKWTSSPGGVYSPRRRVQSAQHRRIHSGWRLYAAGNRRIFFPERRKRIRLQVRNRCKRAG